jgi:hypothetical protein
VGGAHRGTGVTMTSGASTYADFDLDAFLAGQRAGMASLDAALRREGVDPGWVRAEALRQGRVHPIELLRKEARLAVSTVADELGAHLRLPFRGDARLLGVASPDSPAPVPGGVATAGDGGGTLWLRTTFPLGTTSDVIRQWGADQVAQLERTLRATNDRVAAHNASLSDVDAGPAVEPGSEEVARLNRELSGAGV